MELWLRHADVTVATLLAFFRLTAFFVIAPFPGFRAPAIARVALAASCAWAFSAQLAPVAESSILAALGLEIALGLGAGFALQLVVQAFAFGGEVAGTQMGLANANYTNPLLGNLTLLGSAYTVIALGVYAAGDGPLHLIAFLSRYLELIPPGSFAVAFDGQAFTMEAGRTLMAFGIEAAAPVIAAVFAAQLVLGVLARSVRGLNMLIEGPTLTVGAGLVGLTASAYTFAPLVNAGFSRRIDDIARWVGA